MVLPKYFWHENLDIESDQLLSMETKVLFGKIIGMNDCAKLLFLARNGYVGGFCTEVIFVIYIASLDIF